MSRCLCFEMWCIDVCLLSANCTVPDTSAPHSQQSRAASAAAECRYRSFPAFVVTPYYYYLLLGHRVAVWCGRCMYTACRSCRSVPSHSTRIPRRSEQNYWRCRWNFAVIFTIFRALSNLAKYFIEELNSVRPSSGQPWLRLMSLSTTIDPGAKLKM